MDRDYSSIYNIKDFAIKNVAPKYLNMDDVNDLNVGLLGMVTELIGTIAEDGFNTTTTYLNEIFPNKAILPETVYNYAAMFQESDIFAKPAEMMAWLFVLESDILQNATISSTTPSQKNFFIDSDLSIDVEGIHFMLDYDIDISYVEGANGSIRYTTYYNKTRYGTEYKSSLDSDNSHYIKSRIITYNNERYLAMYVKLRQVERYTIEETVISNDVINAPFFKISLPGDIASFEVFCKDPDENQYVQLKKKLIGSAPDKSSKFCYYRMSDDDELEVSFSMKDGYYKPSFGADVIIDYTVTSGTSGEFDLYTGSDIICTGKSDKYEYNNRLILFCITQSPSQFAKDKMGLEELKIRNVENMSTVGSYTTENDLSLYFTRFTNADNVKMYTIKKRNDYQDRLFTTFSLYRDNNGDIIKTNTLGIDISALVNGDNTYTNAFDRFEKLNDTAMFIPAGSVFVYDTSSKRTVLTDYTLDNVPTTYPFVYSNPLMIYLARNPSIIGYYLNSINESYTMDYYNINNESFIQFMCNTLHIKRNATSGTAEERQTYYVTVTMTPTSNPSVETDPDIPSGYRHVVMNGDNGATYYMGTFDMFTGEPLPNDSQSDFSAYLHFDASGGRDNSIPMRIVSYDVQTHIFTLTCEIVTNDHITETEFIVSTLQGGVSQERLIGMYNNSDVYISTFVGNSTRATNVYKTFEPGVTFIKPLNMCNSNITYDKADIIDTIPEEERPQDETELNAFLALVDIYIDSVPLVSTSTLQDITLCEEFFKYYTSQYNYIEDILDNITNNYNIDLKFYNTYGDSKTFHVEDGSIIDSVNIAISFKVKPIHGTDTELLVSDIQLFVKNYIENINDSNINAIYVSNLMKELENTFSAIKYIKFDGITGIQKYGLDTQAIENNATDFETMTAAERRNYVPEYLTIDVEDVKIELI